jgi:hypothetical protein
VALRRRASVHDGLVEAQRRYALGGDGAPIGVNLADALAMLWFVPMIGFPFTVIGAALGAVLTGRPDTRALQRHGG